MRIVAIGLFATAAAVLTVPASAQQIRTPGELGAAAVQVPLSPTARRTRDRLIADPGAIAAVVRAANRANPRDRREIERGIVAALVYLSRYDPAGSRAISTFLADNAGDPVVADVVADFAALTSAAPYGGAGGLGLEGGLGGGGGGFSSSPGSPASVQ
ncbi:hypothetical protein DFR50_12851 [Roseiarcus fermentans]|uniref:Uncharacterized protein n=1 Tax=Roseiarcus fermentans TaxID=1473586 RepID=A0A366EZM6_9HYPH|nr:hypothetical protein [Roseiarcus fermentans]RBP07326.1 hypothetical protein DFR50_12851 [Roseiarcus fermentans]